MKQHNWNTPLNLNANLHVKTAVIFFFFIRIMYIFIYTSLVGLGFIYSHIYAYNHTNHQYVGMDIYTCTSPYPTVNPTKRMIYIQSIIGWHNEARGGCPCGEIEVLAFSVQSPKYVRHISVYVVANLNQNIKVMGVAPSQLWGICIIWYSSRTAWTWMCTYTKDHI